MSHDNSDAHSTKGAIKDVTSAFTRALKQALSDAGTQASKELLEDLRQATNDLNDAITNAGLALAGHGTPKAERTRAKLLQAAGRVIAEKGYEGASVGDIATAAGYTKGAVYANFGSKEQLFIVLARELLAGDITDIASPDPSSPDDLPWKTLAVLEMFLYAIRHTDTRDELVLMLTAAQDDLAQRIYQARSGADTERVDTPTQADHDLAFAETALNIFGGLMGSVQLGSGGPDEVAATVRRLIDRLTDAPDCHQISDVQTLGSE